MLWVNVFFSFKVFNSQDKKYFCGKMLILKWQLRLYFNVEMLLILFTATSGLKGTAFLFVKCAACSPIG